MALKEFESMGRGKAEARRRENEEERHRIREEVEENEERYWEKRNLDSENFYKEALDRLHADDPTRTYDEELLKLLWGTKSELTTGGYDKLVNLKLRHEALKKVETTVVQVPPPAH